MTVIDQQSSRRGFLRLAGALGAAAAFSSTLSACASRDSGTKSSASASGGTAKEDGTITAAISYELGTNGYDPMTTSAALTVAANWHTMEGLTEIDPVSRETYAALATELPKGDGTSVDVALRKGATFHDGSPVTADDVVFSFQRVLDPASNSLYVQFIPFVAGVEKKDDSTVTINLKYPTALLAERLSVVKIVPQKAAADRAAFDAKPVGSGPYMMTDGGGTSKTVQFKRFDAYDGPRPAKAAAMTWQIIPDAATRTNAMQSKSVQAIDSVPYLSVKQLQASGKVESVQGFGLLFAMFNQADASPMATKENRQGFMYAIDTAKVIQTALLGQATAATSFLPKDHPDYEKAATVYDFDQAEAKKLFAGTGLTKVRLLATDHDWVKACSPIIIESLKAAGLEVEFSEKKSAEVYNTIDGKPDAYDVVLAPGDPSVFGNDPDLLLRWWYSGDTWTDKRMHWKGKPSWTQMQTLLDEGIKATDAGDAKKAWKQAFDLAADELPLYPLFHRKAPTAWDSTSLVDFEPIALTGLCFQRVGSTK